MSDEAHRCTDGTGLNVVVQGDPTAPVTVLLVHCYAIDRHDWDPVLPLLTEDPDVRVVSYDHRGFGASDPAAAADCTLDQLGDDLAEVLTTYGGDGPVVLAGHSMGGMAIMALAERHPELVRERVAGVVFVATACSDMPRALTLGLPGPLSTVVHGLERLGVGVLTLLRREVLSRRPKLLEPFVRWLVFGVDARAADVAAVARLIASCRPATLLTFRGTFDEHDRREALANLDGGPAVVLVGDRDRITPPRHAAVIAEWLTTARLVILPGAGHMLPHERPAEVCAAIRSVVAATARAPLTATA